MGPKKSTIDKYYKALFRVVTKLEISPRYLATQLISQEFNIGTRFLPVAVKLNIIRAVKKGNRLIYYPVIRSENLQPLHARDIIEAINEEVKNYTTKEHLSAKEIDVLKCIRNKGYEVNVFKKIKIF